MRITFLLQSLIYSSQAQRGGDRSSGSFKLNRLNRMFSNEITWLDKYFGQTAVTTSEYQQHDNRIREHWAIKLQKNKERLVKRLIKCGGDDSFTNAVAESEGGFSEYDENRAKEEVKVVSSSEKEDLGVLDTDTDTVINTSSGRPSSSGRGRRSIEVEHYDHSNADLEAISGLDFDYDGVEDVSFGVSKVHAFGRSGGRGSGPAFNPKMAINEIRNILQGFAIWAKNHIPNCEPNQPEKQMARASRWFKILGKKVMAKTMHIQATRREGLPVLNG